MSRASEDVQAIINGIANTQRRVDAESLLELLANVTGEKPVVWGNNTIGFGQYHYEYKSGREGEFFNIGFAPRNENLTLYVMAGLRGYEDLLERLGPHTSSKSCVYLKRLDEVDHEVLAELIRESVAHLGRVEESLGAIPRMSDIPPRDEI